MFGHEAILFHTHKLFGVGRRENKANSRLSVTVDDHTDLIRFFVRSLPPPPFFFLLWFCTAYYVTDPWYLPNPSQEGTDRVKHCVRLLVDMSTLNALGQICTISAKCVCVCVRVRVCVCVCVWVCVCVCVCEFLNIILFTGTFLF